MKIEQRDGYSIHTADSYRYFKRMVQVDRSIKERTHASKQNLRLVNVGTKLPERQFTTVTFTNCITRPSQINFAKRIQPQPKQFDCWVVFAQHMDSLRWSACNIATGQVTHNHGSKIKALKHLREKFDVLHYKVVPPLTQHSLLHTSRTRYVNGQWERITFTRLYKMFRRPMP